MTRIERINLDLQGAALMSPQESIDRLATHVTWLLERLAQGIDVVLYLSKCHVCLGEGKLYYGEDCFRLLEKDKGKAVHADRCVTCVGTGLLDMQSRQFIVDAKE